MAYRSEAGRSEAGRSAVRRMFHGERAVILAVFLGAALAGWAYMSFAVGTVRVDSDIEDYMVGISALLATGHGLSITVGNLVPALNDFIGQKDLYLDASRIPRQAPVFPARALGGKFVYDRIYLIYSIALLWRLLGVSWPSLNIFLALVYGGVAAILYGIFRLGINRILSLLCVAISMASPVMLSNLPVVRDFCKAPFILAVILILGHLLSRRVSVRAYLGLSLLVGLIVGVGVGFRQDAIICLPPALVVVGCFARSKNGDRHLFRPPSEIGACHHFSIRVRGAAILIVLMAFLLPGWPVLRMNKDTGGNNSFYLLQGFTLQSLNTLAIRRASYAPFLSLADYVMHANVYAYDEIKQPPREPASLRWAGFKTTMGLLGFSRLLVHPVSAIPYLATARFVYPGSEFVMWGRDAETTARRMVRDLVELFPADMISRWYTTSIHIFTGELANSVFPKRSNDVLKACAQFQNPLTSHLSRYGLYYALAAAALLSFRSVWLALGCIGLVFYFCGYASISFQPRHAFHLHFLSIWIPAFLLDRLLRALSLRAGGPLLRWLKLRGKGGNEEKEKGGNARASFPLSHFPFYPIPWRPALRLLVAGGVTALILGGPLVAARAYQRATVTEMAARYAAAQLEPLESVRQTDAAGETCYKPAHMPGLDRLWGPRAAGLLFLLGIPGLRQPEVMTDYLVAEIETAGQNPYVEIKYEDPGAYFDMWDSYNLNGEPSPSTFRFFFPVYEYTEQFEMPYSGTLSTFKGLVLKNGARLKGFYHVQNRRDFPLLMNVWLPPAPQYFQWCQRIPVFGHSI